MVTKRGRMMAAISDAMISFSNGHVEAGQAVGDEHGRDQRAGHAEPGDDAGVEQQPGKVERLGH